MRAIMCASSLCTRSRVGGAGWLQVCAAAVAPGPGQQAGPRLTRACNPPLLPCRYAEGAARMQAALKAEPDAIEATVDHIYDTVGGRGVAEERGAGSFRCS